MAFDVDGAKAAGYSDAEIAGYLASDKSSPFDAGAAMKAGYSPAEIVAHVASLAKPDTGTYSADDTNSSVDTGIDGVQTTSLPQTTPAPSAVGAGRGFVNPPVAAAIPVGPPASIGTVATGLQSALAGSAYKVVQGLRMAYADATGDTATSVDAIKNIKEADKQLAEDTPAFDSNAAQMAYTGVSGLATAAPMLAVGAVNPAAGLGLFAAQSGAEGYGKYRARGATPGEAALGGGLEAGIMAATAYLPLSFIADKIGKVGVGQFVTGLVARDVPTMVAQGIANDMVDTAVANPDKTWGDFVDEQPAHIAQSVVSAGIFAAGMGVAHAGVQQAAKLGDQIGPAADTTTAPTPDVDDQQAPVPPVAPVAPEAPIVPATDPIHTILDADTVEDAAAAAAKAIATPTPNSVAAQMRALRPVTDVAPPLEGPLQAALRSAGLADKELNDSTSSVPDGLATGSSEPATDQPSPSVVGPRPEPVAAPDTVDNPATESSQDRAAPVAVGSGPVGDAEAVAPVTAIWHASDTDYPVQIAEGSHVGPDGREYQAVTYQGRQTFVPAEELTNRSDEAPTPRAPVDNTVSGAAPVAQNLDSARSASSEVGGDGQSHPAAVPVSSLADRIEAMRAPPKPSLADRVEATRAKPAPEPVAEPEQTPAFSRNKDEPFYSALARGVEAIKASAAPAAAWKDAIKGLVNKGAVKADEVDRSGVNDWLDLQNGRVTKDQVSQYLDGNGVKVSETTLSGDKYFRDAQGNRVFDNETGDYVASKAPAKFENYTLPGGKNYREVLLTLPERSKVTEERVQSPRGWGDTDGGDVGVRRTGGENDFRSGHWDQPNVLAHIRLNDRTDADGKKTLFVEEMQSDWGQQGKKKGFADPAAAAKAAEIQAEMSKLAADRLPSNQMREERRWLELAKQRDALTKASQGLPSAPFVGKTESWLGLAMRRVVKMAADGGYDRVAFANGEQSAARYSLSKQVDSVSWEPTSTDGNSRIVELKVPDQNPIRLGLDENGVVKQAAGPGFAGFKDKPIDEVVGKDLGAKIMAEERGSLAGDGLNVGGEGMKTFYDKIVPNVAKDVVRKMGGDGLRDASIDSPSGHLFDPEDAGVVQSGSDAFQVWVDSVPLPRDFTSRAAAEAFAASGGRGSATKQVGFDITPKMRAQVADGVPLFKRGASTDAHTADLQSAVDSIKTGWKNAPDVVIAKNLQDEAIPEAVRARDQEQRSQGATGDPEGFFYKGKVYLLSDQIHSEADAARVMLHESLGHYGLRGVFGKELNPILDRVALLNSDAVKAKAQAYGLDFMKPGERRAASEEVLSELAQTDPKSSVVRQAIAAIRTWIRENLPGFANMKLSDDEIIRNYLNPARDFVKNGAGAADDNAVRFSRTATADDEDQTVKPPKATAFGKLREAAQGVHDSILMGLSPMSLGNDETRNAARNFSNALRASRHDFIGMDEVLKKNYTDKQAEAMWNAGDEQNDVLMQNRAPNPKEGLNLLPSDQHELMDTIQQMANEQLQEATRIGLFDGQGVKFWAPRMIALIDADGSVSAPKSGEPYTPSPGRNLSTTASSLRGRKYDQASGTEAAAKAKFGDDATLVRSVRAYPLAMAKIQNAIAGRNLVNAIREIGRRTGMQTTSEGDGPGFFTLDHPALKTFTPRLARGEDGVWEPLLDANGNPVMDKKPIYISKDFEGPLKAVLSEDNPDWYKALMQVKGKSMGLIMYSPLIHNAVEYSRAFPIMPGKMLTLALYKDGADVIANPTMMRKAIGEGGVVPIGHRGGIQDITGIAEAPNLKAGRSITSQIVAAPVSLVSKSGALAVKKGIDAAGDFYHNKLLWDQVAKLQMGLWKNAYDNYLPVLMKKGLNPEQADKVANLLAGHIANRYAGALPNEAMSAAARKWANILFFSRSFTFGNLGVMKDTITGLPKDVKSQIMIAAGDLGMRAGTSIARQKAIKAFVLDMGLMYVSNSLLQYGIEKLKDNTDWWKSDGVEGAGLGALVGGRLGLGGAVAGGIIGAVLGTSVGAVFSKKVQQDFLNRASAASKTIKDHPLDAAMHPWNSASSFTPNSGNEPNKEDRIYLGKLSDGTAVYAKSSLGKTGEDFKSWVTNIPKTMYNKSSQFVKPLVDVGVQAATGQPFEGRPIWSPSDSTLTAVGKAIVHIGAAQIGLDTMSGVADWAQGQASEMDKAKLLAPLAGITVSKGAPGGPAVGELYAEQRRVEAEREYAMPAIQKALKLSQLSTDPAQQSAQYDQALQMMQDLKMTPGQMRTIITHTLEPESRLNNSAVKKFSKTASDEDKAKLESLMGQ